MTKKHFEGGNLKDVKTTKQKKKIFDIYDTRYNIKITLNIYTKVISIHMIQSQDVNQFIE